MHRRAQKYGKQQTSGKYLFSGMITCAGCGKHYRRKVTATGPVRICRTYNTHGKAACPSKAIPESSLMEIAATVSATGEITAVTTHNNNTLEFTLVDGTTPLSSGKTAPEPPVGHRRCVLPPERKPEKGR